MTNTAVVILNFNGEDYLKNFLPSVLQYSGNAEIIVADNKSTDNSIKILKEEFPSVRLIELAENYGFAGGYNKALEQVNSEFLILLNSDVEVTENWLTPMIKFLNDNPSYAACQPKVKDHKKPEKFEYAGASGGFIDSLGYPYCRGRIFDTIEDDKGQYDEPLDIFWAAGACLVIRNKIFKEVGGLDIDFFAHMEEIDLCWRIKSLGHKIKAIPDAVIYHVGGGTLSKLSPVKTHLNFRNGLYMLIKNLPIKNLILKFPLRIFLDWIAVIKFIIEGNGKHGLAVLKAHFDVLFTFNKTLKKRELFSNPPTKRLVVADYYLRKKRKFDEI